MTRANYTKSNATRLITLIFIGVFVMSNSLDAQQLREKFSNTHLGLTASFGIKSNTLLSNLQQIDNLDLLTEGGNMGVIYGNRILEASLLVGFMYSGPKVPHTIDLRELNAEGNLYPLQLFSKEIHLFEPYITGGVSRSQYRFHGFYGNDNQSAKPNYSVSIEPYLGDVNVYYSSVGAGIICHIVESRDFLNLFADVRYSQPFKMEASALFVETRMQNQTSFNLGVRFGRNFKSK